MLFLGKKEKLTFIILFIRPGEQFAVFRGMDGEVYVLDAYCPHLGANLAVGGHVVGNCIECPFHGWIFSGKDGSCVKIPYAKKGDRVAFPVWAKGKPQGV